MSRRVALEVLGDLSAGPSVATPTAPRARYATANTVEDKLKILSALIAKDRENPAVDLALGHALGRKTGDAHKLDTFRRPARTLQLGIGDCDDAATVVGAMASAAGYQVGLRVVETGSNTDWNHVYNVVGLPRTNPTRWVPIDATMDKGVGWEVSGPQVNKVKTFLAEGNRIREIAGLDSVPWLGWAAALVGGAWLLGKV